MRCTKCGHPLPCGESICPLCGTPALSPQSFLNQLIKWITIRFSPVKPYVFAGCTQAQQTFAHSMVRLTQTDDDQTAHSPAGTAAEELPDAIAEISSSVFSRIAQPETDAADAPTPEQTERDFLRQSISDVLKHRHPAPAEATLDEQDLSQSVQEALLELSTTQEPETEPCPEPSGEQAADTAVPQSENTLPEDTAETERNAPEPEAQEEPAAVPGHSADAEPDAPEAAAQPEPAAVREFEEVPLTEPAAETGISIAEPSEEPAEQAARSAPKFFPLQWGHMIPALILSALLLAGAILFALHSLMTPLEMPVRPTSEEQTSDSAAESQPTDSTAAVHQPFLML